MRLIFQYLPVDDLKAALALYRDRLGFTEAWREGDTTVGLQMPDTDVLLMLDVIVDQDAQPVGPGPVFQVDDVDRFRAEHDDLRFTYGPIEIPDGRWTAFRDPSGNTVHLIESHGEDGQ